MTLTYSREVLCSATVDQLSSKQWEVTVTGLAPHDRTRVYTIGAKDDNAAAKQGISDFISEMQNLSEGDD